MDKIVQLENPVVGAIIGAAPATCDLRIGPRYHTLWLEVMATGAAGKTLVLSDVLDLINVKINGKIQRAHKATELDYVNTFFDANLASTAYAMDGNGNISFSAGGGYQAPGVAGQALFTIPICFAESWRKSYAATEAGAWYTSWQDGSTLKSFQLEIFIPNTGNIDNTKPFTVSVYSETDSAIGPLDSNKQPVALITKWNRQNFPYGGAGDLYITNLAKRDIYAQMDFFTRGFYGGQKDDITAAKVKVDGRIIRDVTKTRNVQTLIGRDFNKSGVSENVLNMVFDYSDLPTDGLVMQAGSAQVKDFTVILTLGAAADATKIITSIAQIYGGID